MNNKENEKLEYLKVIVLNEISKASKENPAKSKELCNNLGLSFRHLKKVIAHLRDEYPIVSKETAGGGYWLAKDDLDILNYVKMMQTRVNGYEDTVEKMLLFIANNTLDDEHIPHID